MAMAGGLMQAGYLGGVFAAIHQGMPAGVARLGHRAPAGVHGGPRRLAAAERASRPAMAGPCAGLAGVIRGRRGPDRWLQGSVPAIRLSVLALASITLGTVWQKRHGAAWICAPGPRSSSSPRQRCWRRSPSCSKASRCSWIGAVPVRGRLAGAGAFARRDLSPAVPDPAGRGDSRVASLFYLVPPTTAVMAWPLFGENTARPPPRGWGSLCSAVWLVTS